MTKVIPDEIQIAKLSIEAACAALESLSKRMRVMPRSEKVIVSDSVNEACSRLRAAKELLAKLEAVPAGDDDA
jgi:UDP-N-acetylmuramyl pentapeptide synthase